VKYREAVNLLNIERERWERAMTQYAKVCHFLSMCVCVCVFVCLSVRLSVCLLLVVPTNESQSGLVLTLIDPSMPQVTATDMGAGTSVPWD